MLFNDSLKIFISYSWLNKDIADLIQNDFEKMGIIITRDIDILRYKDSISMFMKTIREHDFVLMLISDSYLKSENCMFEVLELMKDKNYSDKMLMITLKDEDKKYYKEYENRIDSDEEFKKMIITADVYSFEGRANYVEYWEQKKIEAEKRIKCIQSEISKRNLAESLKIIYDISVEIDSFIGKLKDLNGKTLKELKEEYYESIKLEIEKSQDNGEPSKCDINKSITNKKKMI